MISIVDVALITMVMAVATVSSKADEGTYRGFLVIAPEVEVFEPCGSDEPLWLDYTPELRKVLFERYEELRTQPYEETYVELRGVPGPQLDCAFCEEYSGSFKVEAVVEQRARQPTDCHDA